MHPDDDRLIDHALFGDREVAEHVAGCAECQERLDACLRE